MDIFSEFNHKHSSLLLALVMYIPLAVSWHYFLRKKQEYRYEVRGSAIEPLPVTLGIMDYIKAFLSWLLLFMRIFSVRPRYYFTGQNNEESTLLVTCKNFLPGKQFSVKGISMGIIASAVFTPFFY